MRIAVLNQSHADDNRCPLLPTAVGRIVRPGVEVIVESGCGTGSQAPDAAYEQSGASIGRDTQQPGSWLGSADIVLSIHPPPQHYIEAMRDEAVLIGLFNPSSNVDAVRAMAGKRLTVLSLDYLPRISRAQSMDVLSSQANIAGYKAVILGAEQCRKMFPMMITAAGTLAPAKVFIIGAGVAGLQAIATAKRLGAVVEAYDVRATTREQVQSLGARFVELDTGGQDDADTGGYAKEQSEEQRTRQIELMARNVVAADVVICTAAVFGKQPPLLIPGDVVGQMNSGSVIVDLAADAASDRGNCEWTRPGQMWQTDNGVTLIGTLNLPSTVPAHASQALGTNINALLQLLIDEEGRLTLNREDEIITGVMIVHQGEVVNEQVRSALEQSVSS